MSQTTSRRYVLPWPLILLTAVVLVGLELWIGPAIYTALTSPAAPHEELRPMATLAGARQFCEQAVTAQLRAPATAKFSPAAETPGGDTGHGWAVTGWVDSQNGFGALIRSNYGCQMTFTGQAWTLDNIAVVPR